MLRKTLDQRALKMIHDIENVDEPRAHQANDRIGARTLNVFGAKSKINEALWFESDLPQVIRANQMSATFFATWVSYGPECYDLARFIDRVVLPFPDAPARLQAGLDALVKDYTDNRYPSLEVFMAAGAPVYAPRSDHEGRSPFVQIAMSHGAETIRQLLDTHAAGRHLNVLDDNGWNILDWASCSSLYPSRPLAILTSAYLIHAGLDPHRPTPPAPLLNESEGPPWERVGPRLPTLLAKMMAHDRQDRAQDAPSVAAPARPRVRP